MKKKIPNRKRTAIFWTLGTVMLGVLVWVLLPWSFTPEIAHRQSLKGQYITGAEIVCEEETPFERKLIFSLNEYVVAGGVYTKKHLLSWEPHALGIAEREEGRPFAAGYTCEYESDRGSEQAVDNYCIFGVIQDEGIVRITLEFHDLTSGCNQSVHLTEEAWIVLESGEKFFLWKPEPVIGNRSRDCKVIGYYADGAATDIFHPIGVPKWESVGEPKWE